MKKKKKSVTSKPRATKEVKAAALMGARDKQRVESEGKNRLKNRRGDEWRRRER